MNLFVSAAFWSSSLTRLSTSDSRDLPTWRKTTATCTCVLIFYILSFADQTRRRLWKWWRRISAFTKWSHLLLLVSLPRRMWSSEQTLRPLWTLSSQGIISRSCHPCHHFMTLHDFAGWELRDSWVARWSSRSWSWPRAARWWSTRAPTSEPAEDISGRSWSNTPKRKTCWSSTCRRWRWEISRKRLIVSRKDKTIKNVVLVLLKLYYCWFKW